MSGSLRVALALVLLCSFLVSPVPVAAGGSVRVTLNGYELQMPSPPVIVSDRTLVPMRAIFEALGAVVQWNGETRSVTGTRGDIVVQLTIDSPDASVCGKAVELDVPAQLIGDYTYVPARFVSEALGAAVRWDGATRTVVITQPVTEILAPYTAEQLDRLIKGGSTPRGFEDLFRKAVGEFRFNGLRGRHTEPGDADRVQAARVLREIGVTAAQLASGSYEVERRAPAAPPFAGPMARLPLATPPPAVKLPVTYKGAFPNGTGAIDIRIQKVYPYLVKFLGNPYSIGVSGITMTWDPAVSFVNPRFGYYPDRDEVVTGPLFSGGGDDGIANQALHEIAHAFYDTGAECVHMTFGQWIGEAPAIAAGDLALDAVDGIGSSRRVIEAYDALSNLGWEVLNGVMTDGYKYERGDEDFAAGGALRMLAEVLSHDTDFDFLARVNAELFRRQRAGGAVFISKDEYRQILNEVGGDRRIDGMKAGDWLFAQPVANTSGKLGTYLSVVPYYNQGVYDGKVPPVAPYPSEFRVAAFVRTPGKRASDGPVESGLNLEVRLTVRDSAGKVVGQTTVRTGANEQGNGLARVAESDGNMPFDFKQLAPGAYLVEAEATYGGQVLRTSNFFAVLPADSGTTEPAYRDDRMFIVPMDASGRALRPELVDEIQVTGGVKESSLPGMIVIRADPGAAVQFRVGDFTATLSKPVTARLAPLRVP